MANCLEATFLSQGRRYFDESAAFSSKPRFSRLTYKDRRHITTIIRVRTGHCLVPQQLFRLERVDSLLCHCGSQGTLKHILFQCDRMNPGTCLQGVLSSSSSTIINLICHFLKVNNIDL